jgi:hypothetical protein
MDGIAAMAVALMKTIVGFADVESMDRIHS